MAGRPPKPTPIKLLEGNPGKRKINASEPMPQVGRPHRPTWLAKSARRHWASTVARLEEMRVLTMADGPAVALLCNALAEYNAACDEVAEHGTTFVEKRIDKDGALVDIGIKANPAVAIRNDAWRRANLMMQQFGLTSSSRVKLHVEPPSTLSEFEREFGSG